jgi:hypothetical protein
VALNKIKKLTSEYGIAALLAIILAGLFWFVYFNKIYPQYNVNIVRMENIQSKHNEYFDMNGNGISEEIEINHEFNTHEKSYISIRTMPFENRVVFAQLNWDMTFVKRTNIYAGDYDNDGKKELFLFFRNDTTIFLDGVKLDIDNNIEGEVFFHKKIDSIKIVNHQYEDFICYINGLADINNDGYKDLIFNINGFYCAYPRKLYCYDIFNDTLYVTDEKYKIYSDNGFQIARQDGNYFFLPGKIRAPENFDDTSYYYNDHYVWLYLVNNKFTPAFKPKKLLRGYSNYNWQCFVNYKGALCFISAITQKNRSTSLTIYDIKGSPVKSINPHSNYGMRLYPSTDTTKYLCEVLTGNELLFYDVDLNVVNRLEIPNYEDRCRNIKILNTDNDSEMEFLATTDYGNYLQLFDDNFDLIFKIKLDIDIGLALVSKIKNRSNKNLIQVTDNINNLIISYSRNPKYYLSFVYSVLTGIFFFFLINIAFRQRLKYLNNQNKREKELIESQLKIANRQMSPHFQLNVLNTISYLFERDKKKAHYYLGKYSRLVTETMMNVDKITTTLENELNFTKNYLSLEQLRMNHQFDFIIDIDERLDLSMQIPRMLIFTFCENAVKHGLRHKENRGSLNISAIKENEKTVVFTIEDNGIGRKKSAQLKTHGTGMGLKTLRKIINYHNETHNGSISYFIADKYEGGTKVTIKIKY